MKDIEYDRLIALIRDSNDPVGQFCLDLIRNSRPEYSVGNAISATEVWDIYSKRQLWNDSVANPKRNRIAGYESLMKRLPKASDQQVRIHTFEWHDVTVTFFTDKDIASLFGALQIPKT